ncbi:MAG: acyl-CoA dehydrogenase family protein [Chloroflexi bacterium]|nr:acyl-CoA dehydrogenase family protein [Chloroflexota bacterium]
MEFRWTPEQETFRGEIRGFLARELPAHRASGDEEGGSREFSRKLGQKGWIGLAWPREFGGKGLGYMERLIYAEEMVLSGAPIGYHHNAERQMGPSIIMFGTDEQRAEFLPRITRGECSFAIGYSEPDTGSDLASLKTRAVEDGDDYVINGAKVWNNAHRNDYLWLAARTNPDAPKHRGISVFIVDMKAPGVAAEPLRNMANEPSFCLVTFQDVRVPKRMMVGERDRGWYVVAGNLDFERSGIERVGRFYPLWQEFLGFVREARFNGGRLLSDVRVRHRLAETAIEFEVGRLLCYKVAWMMAQGKVPNMEASVSKLFGTEAAQRMARTMSEVLGLYGQLEPGSRWAPLAGKVERAWIGAISHTIAAGTSEIQRNIIATRGLGLPRG